MNKFMRRAYVLPILVATGLLTASPGVLADNNDKRAAVSGAGLTVFMDVGAFGRKKKAATKMTELHKSYFDQGYTVIDVAPYVENGDLQGFFITYVAR